MSATPDVPRRERLQRSELAVPATSERFFVKACASDAGGVIDDCGHWIPEQHPERIADEMSRFLE